MTRTIYDALDSNTRVHLFTTLLGVRQPVLVGTRHENGVANLAVFNSLQHYGSNPPLLGLMFRPDRAPRHTLRNIRRTGEYTIQLVPYALADVAHQTAKNLPEGESEFVPAGLTEIAGTTVGAPLVQECPVRFELQFREEHFIKTNDTWLVLGEVVHLHFPEAAILADGHFQQSAVGTAGIIGNNGYFPLPEVAQWRPEKP